MKKIFAFVAMAAMLMACGDDNDKTQGGNNPGPNIDPSFDCAITIDGQYGDWNALTTNVQVATLPEGDVAYSQLKTFKVYADEIFIHIFCEFDPTNTLVFVPYFDFDSDVTTGTTSKWEGSGYEGKAEGDIFEWSLDADGVPVEQQNPKMWNPGFYIYNDLGETECVLEAGLGAVISSTPAPTTGGLYAFEASIVREMLYGYPLGSSLSIGMIQYDQYWSYVGQLPCLTLADIDAGELETMLTVELP